MVKRSLDTGTNQESWLLTVLSTFTVKVHYNNVKPLGIKNTNLLRDNLLTKINGDIYQDYGLENSN